MIRTSDWQNITGDLPNIPVHTVLEMPYDSDILWAGTDIGLFISENGGTNWEYTTDNIPAVSIRRLKLYRQRDYCCNPWPGYFYHKG
jgi:hypothetical protein